MTASTGPISYRLEIEVAEPLCVKVGSLGRLLLPAGRYVYTGSATKNLQARVRRHLEKGKAKRWHIDYVLAAPGVRVVGVKLSRARECALNRRTRGAVLFPGLGASDCRSGCGSHLKYLGSRVRGAGRAECR